MNSVPLGLFFSAQSLPISSENGRRKTDHDLEFLACKLPRLVLRFLLKDSFRWKYCGMYLKLIVKETIVPAISVCHNLKCSNVGGWVTFLSSLCG